MGETTQQAYDRGEEAGRTAGQIAARLDVYDQHFRAINGSVEKTAIQLEAMKTETLRALNDLKMAVQGLTDQAIADARTRVTTANAVEKARSTAAEALETERVARKDKAETTWSPVTRLVAIASLIGTVIAIATAIAAWVTK